MLLITQIKCRKRHIKGRDLDSLLSSYIAKALPIGRSHFIMMLWENQKATLYV